MFDRLSHGWRDEPPLVGGADLPSTNASTVLSRLRLTTPSTLGVQLRHCWVTDEHGRLPRLLLVEGRRTTAGWQGRVVRPPLEPGGWVAVEEWVGAERLARTVTDERT